MLQKKVHIATVMLTSNEIFCINEALKLKVSFKICSFSIFITLMTSFFIGQGQHIVESDNAVFIELFYYFLKKLTFTIMQNRQNIQYML